jgi:hypothetical protein
MKNVLWWAVVITLLMLFVTGGCSELTTATQTEPALVSEPATTTQGPPAPITEIGPIPELPRDFPESLRWLTEDEKAKPVEIALDTPRAQHWLQKVSQYRTDIGWIALYPSTRGEGYSGSYWKFEYEVVEIGIPRGEVRVCPEGSSVGIVYKGVPEDAGIYPYVSIGFGEPTKMFVSIAIDLESWEVVFQEELPPRNTTPTDGE